MLVELSPRAGSDPGGPDAPAPGRGPEGPPLSGRAGWLIALLSVLPHLGALGGGFVYDDFRFVSENPGVQTLADPHELLLSSDRASQPADHDIWRPLRTLGFALQHAVFGPSAVGFHAISLCLHLLLVRALIAWLGVLVRDPRAVAAGALLFGVHPLTVECTAWISSQGDLIAAAASFAALAAFRRRPALAVILGAVALLGKESALPLAAVLIGDRWISARDPAATGRALGERRFLVPIVTLALLTIAYLVVRQGVLDRGAGLGAQGFGQVEAETMRERLRTFAHNVLQLLRWFFLPTGLSVDHTREGLGTPGVYHLFGGAVALGALLGLARKTLTTRPGVARGLHLALWTFLPTAGLIVTLRSPIAERFLLMPLGGVCAATAALAAGRLNQRPAMALAAALLVTLSATTLSRTLDWRDQESLFEAALEVDPDSIQAHLALGAERAEASPDDAAEHYERVLELTEATDPRRWSTLSNLGQLERARGDLDVAVQRWEDCRRAIQRSGASDLDPGLSFVWLSLTDAARQRLGPEFGESIANEGIELFGRDPDLLHGLAVCRALQEDYPTAITLYKEAAAGGGDGATLRYHLAVALKNLGRTGEAIVALQQALKLQPDHELSEALLRELGGDR